MMLYFVTKYYLLGICHKKHYFVTKIFKFCDIFVTVYFFDSYVVK